MNCFWTMSDRSFIAFTHLSLTLLSHPYRSMLSHPHILFSGWTDQGSDKMPQQRINLLYDRRCWKTVKLFPTWFEQSDLNPLWIPLGCIHTELFWDGLAIRPAQDAWSVNGIWAGKTQVLLTTLMMALFYSSVLVSHDSVTVSQHAQYQDPETEAAKWNSVFIKLFTPLLFLLWHVRLSSVKGHPSHRVSAFLGLVTQPALLCFVLFYPCLPLWIFSCLLTPFWTSVACFDGLTIANPFLTFDPVHCAFYLTSKVCWVWIFIQLFLQQNMVLYD